MADKKKPIPRPRTSLQNKPSLEEQSETSCELGNKYRCDGQVSSDSSRSISRSLSYQNALDSCMIELSAKDEPESTNIGENDSSGGVSRSELKAENNESERIKVSESARPSHSVLQKEAAELCQLRKEARPPLPERIPVGWPYKHVQKQVTKSRLYTEEASEGQRAKANRTNVSTSASVPNISLHQEMLSDVVQYGQELEHSHSSVDVMRKDSLSVVSSSSVEHGTVRNNENKKYGSKNKRHSSQFYYDIEGQEQEASEINETHWWSFGKAGKKSKPKKDFKGSRGSVFYCAVIDDLTSKFKNQQLNGEQKRNEVNEMHKSDVRHDNVTRVKTATDGFGVYDNTEMNNQRHVNPQKVLNSTASFCVDHQENVPKLPPNTDVQLSKTGVAPGKTDCYPLPPPRRKKKHSFLENVSDNTCGNKSAPDNKDKELFCQINSGDQNVIETSTVCDHSQALNSAKGSSEVKDIKDSSELKPGSDYEHGLGSISVDSTALDVDDPGRKPLEEKLSVSVVRQSDSSASAQKQDDDCRTEACSNLLVDDSSIYVSMAGNLESHSDHSCVSSASSSEYISMRPQTMDALTVSKAGADLNVRPSSWAGPESDLPFLQYGGQDYTMLQYDVSSNSSSNESDENEDEESLTNTLNKLADIKAKLAKKNINVFYAAKEIMTSEESFVEALKIINEDFRQHVLNSKGSLGGPIIPMKEVDKVLKYLPLLHNFGEELLKDLKLRINNWDSCQKIADVFIKKGPFLKMYTDYIREFEAMTSYFEELRKRYPGFNEAVNQFEQSPTCNNIPVKTFMLKPIQRIPQYRLLLQEYKKYLDEDSDDYEDSKIALEIVSEVAEHANKSMALENNLKDLMEVQNSLMGDFEVVKPGRVLIKSGTLQKLCRKGMQPRKFFLFNDTLLCTVPVASGFKYKMELSLNGMKVKKPKEEDFANEFSIVSTARSFRLSASTSRERDEWLNVLRDAIGEYRQRRDSYLLQTSKHTNQTVPMDDSGFVLGKQAPVWVPDSRVSMCAYCHQEFTVTFRRHHCRACGQVFCGRCSDNWAPLYYQGGKSGRVCVTCFILLKKELTLQIQRFEANGQARLRDAMLQLAQEFYGHSSQSAWNSLSRRKRKPWPLVPELKEVDRRGYMEIWENRRWKRMWFALKEKVLYFYKASEDTAAVKKLVLVGFVVKTMNKSFQKVDPSLLFMLTHKNLKVILKTESVSTRDKWLEHIRQAVIL